MRTLAEVDADLADLRQAKKNTLVAVEQSGSGGRKARRTELSELLKYEDRLLAERAAILNGGSSISFGQPRVRGGW